MTIQVVALTAGGILFPLLIVYAGLMDLATMKIRNWLVLLLATAWLVLAPLAGLGLAEIGWNLGVAGLVFVASFTFFALGWIGGGDAKLATVSVLWFEPDQAILFFTYTSLLGGLLALVILQLRTRPLLPSGFYRVPFLASVCDPKGGIPYGAAIAPAALIVFPDTLWFAHAA